MHGIIGGRVADTILRRFGESNARCSGASYLGKSKLGIMLGSDIRRELRGKTVIDFGSGEGAETIEIAQQGPTHVIGLDIRERLLAVGREKAFSLGLTNLTFTRVAEGKADTIIALDSFEHFSDPVATLNQMAQMLNPGGKVIAAFGPTWYHPYGGHLFSVFPWAHLVFTETALIRWRSRIRNDGARRFCEVEGGLNQMTIRRFEELIQQSPFEFEYFECVPIRSLRRFHSRITREFFTSIVRCKLRLRHAA